MKLHLSIAVLACALGVAIAPVAIASQEPSTQGHTRDLVIKSLPPKSPAKLTVTSPAFKEGADIPYENTQYRGNVFPGLSWTKGPAGTRSYAVIVQGESLTRPGAATSIHLTLFNVPANVATLKPGMTEPPAGATYGQNIHGVNQHYAGPHAHTPAKNGYHYQVFALDTGLKLYPATTFDEMVTAMTGHVLASGDLMGVSARDPNATDAPLNAGPTRIETGLISGVSGRDRSIMVYKGIPYAAPPVYTYITGCTTPRAIPGGRAMGRKYSSFSITSISGISSGLTRTGK
jgi:para-nitrobenzyl esterase